MARDKSKQKTYVFIDASNIIYGASDGGWRVDFKKLHKYLRERFGAGRCLYYAGLDISNVKQLRFYEKLQEFGFELRLVPVKVFKDGKKKADVDSRMTFEMMKYINEYEMVIAMTGDGDYYWVLEYLKSRKNVKLISHAKSTARELKRLFAERFVNIHDLKQLVEKK